jgi:GMP synthase (glutamine-hydrolysing)
MLENFLVKIAEVPQNFTPTAFVEEMVWEVKDDKKSSLGLSGGRFYSGSSFIASSYW